MGKELSSELNLSEAATDVLYCITMHGGAAYADSIPRMNGKSASGVGELMRAGIISSNSSPDYKTVLTIIK